MQSLKKLSGISQKNKPGSLVKIRGIVKPQEQVFSVARIIDANLNRSKEGLRVCEEITRFILDSHKITSQLKAIRHEIDALSRSIYPAARLISQRSVLTDVGRCNSSGELKRANCKDIFQANIQRVKESLRVLEEFSKLIDSKGALGFKRLRYKVYEIEKKSFKKVSAISNFR